MYSWLVTVLRATGRAYTSMINSLRKSSRSPAIFASHETCWILLGTSWSWSTPLYSCDQLPCMWLHHGLCRNLRDCHLLMLLVMKDLLWFHSIDSSKQRELKEMFCLLKHLIIVYDVSWWTQVLWIVLMVCWSRQLVSYLADV